MKPAESSRDSAYTELVSGLGGLLETARRATVRTVHTLMTATYWEFGRRIVEFEQGGSKRAAYGEELLRTLSADLSARFGRGFGVDNLELFRAFYLAYPRDPLPPGTTKSESVIRKLPPEELVARFPLTWTHYVQLLRRARTPEAREFYERQALRGGWSVRQLTRQISSLFYERTALSRDKAAMLAKGARHFPQFLRGADIVIARQAPGM